MDGAYSASPTRPLLTRRRAIGGAVTALGVMLITIAVAALVWARGYEPLSYGQGASGADVPRGHVVHPVGFTGKSVYFPRYRRNGTFFAMFPVENTGRFDVEIIGLPREEFVAPGVFPKLLGVLHRCCHPNEGVSRVDERHPLRIPPGEIRHLHVVYGMRGCAGGTPRDPTRNGTRTGTDRIRLRYRYLRFFERVAFVEMPMELVLACRNGLKFGPGE
jgi:hypothetical protein